jgi:hypothetical protein
LAVSLDQHIEQVRFEVSYITRDENMSGMFYK